MVAEEKTITSADAGGTPTSDRGALAIQWVAPTARRTVLALSQATPLVIGRQSSCAIALPGNEISRAHAEILREGALVTIRDLGSHNGVFVGGQRVTLAPLRAGDVLRLGEWVGVILHARAVEIAGEQFGLIAPGLYGGRVLRETLAPLERVARSDLPIAIQGETGTGKEWTARAIHQWSGRSGPFLAVNCAALPESLAEAELFGYRKGAFTGAERASLGYFRAAHGGTLLLDEIVDLHLGLQAKLLRVLEQREVVPLGEATAVPIDVRIVTAAQQSLTDAVEQGKCRADLCARLEGLPARLPPLRERVEDAPGLFQVKLAQYANRAQTLEGAFVERLCLYDWPFNVREVDLLARRLAVLHAGEPRLRAMHLPERLHAMGHAAKAASTEGGCPEAMPAETRKRKRLNRDERDMARLLDALRRHRGNVAQAAREVEISRQRAYRLMGAGTDRTERETTGGEQAGVESTAAAFKNSRTSGRMS